MADKKDKFSELNNTPDTTAEFDPADVQSNKAMGVLAYLSWLVLIPLFAAKNSKFARFHANQGIVLAIAWTAWWIVEVILGAIFSAIFTVRYYGIPVGVSTVGSILITILGLLNLVFVALAILGIVNAANGKAKELPVIGKFKILK